MGKCLPSVSDALMLCEVQAEAEVVVSSPSTGGVEKFVDIESENLFTPSWTIVNYTSLTLNNNHICDREITYGPTNTFHGDIVFYVDYYTETGCTDDSLATVSEIFS